jgi:hypothetical protein
VDSNILKITGYPFLKICVKTATDDAGNVNLMAFFRELAFRVGVAVFYPLLVGGRTSHEPNHGYHDQQAE